MRTSVSFVVLVAALALPACGGEEAAATAAPTGETAAAAPAAAAAPGAPADDPQVCCEFNGVAGSSTRSLCESYEGGRVVPDAQCAH